MVLIEALAALLDVPRCPKAALLTDSGSGWAFDEQLSPAAERAFTAIFKEQSRAGVMDATDMGNYLSVCGVSGATK